MTKVTVLMAAYNAERFVGESLDSLLAQTMTDWQCVCVDDASTDSTPEILRKYAARDSRVEVLRLDVNGGQAHARNMALERARGKYVCMLDSDDWLSADALQCACDVLDSHPDTGCVLFQVEEVEEGRRRRYPMPSFSRITGQEAFRLSLTWAIHGLYMVRADIHKRFPYDDTTRAYSDDNTTRIHYLHSRVVEQCAGIYYYRQHPVSTTHAVGIRRFDYLRANESMKRSMEKEQTGEELISTYEKVRWLNLIDTYMFYFQYRNLLTAEERHHGLYEMRRVWGGIETHRLPMALKLKPGYMPLRPFWPLFRLQLECYFTLRRWMGRL